MKFAYKIGTEYRYPTNRLKIDNGGIGVEFLMNGSIFLFREKIPSYISKRDIEMSSSLVKNLGVIKVDVNCIYFKVNEKTDGVYVETDEIIYPTKSIIGSSENHPIIMDNSPESQIFRSESYRNFTYSIYWDESYSGIDLSKYKGIRYLGDDYWILDEHFKKTKRKNRDGYFYDSNNSVYEPRKISGNMETFNISEVSDYRKSVFREFRFNKLLGR